MNGAGILSANAKHVGVNYYLEMIERLSPRRRLFPARCLLFRCRRSPPPTEEEADADRHSGRR